MRKKHLLNMIESLPGVVYQYQYWQDGRSVFSFCSGSVEALLFVTSAELARDGAQAWNYVLEEYREPIAQAFSESAETLERLSISFRVSSPQGEIIWLQNRATPEKQDDGSVVWYGHMVDISAKVAAEEEQKRKDSLLRELFSNLPDQIYYKDVDGRLLDANPACCEHHGRALDEMIGLTDKDLYPGTSGEDLFAVEQRVMRERTILSERERHVRADGSVVYLDTVKCPLLSKSGRLFGVAGISRDVTEHVENTRALEKSRKEAELSAGFIQALFDNLEDNFYYKDEKSRVLGGNLAWIKARGAEHLDELLGKTDLDMHPAPLGQELYDAEQELIQSGGVARKREKHVLENGAVKYWESIKCPMKNETGETIGLAGVSRDITAQVQTEQGLIEARQAADSANKAKSMFLAMMSHEIRTPMNGIIGAASLLEGTELSALQKEFVHTINVSGENLITLINDILDYSKIEAGKIILEQTPFSLRECIEDCFDLFAQSAGKKNIELLHHVDTEVPHRLIGDPTRLRQIIINLVGNAVKFTDKGEIALEVRREAPGGAGADLCGLQVSVRDTGCGIPEEVQENLFTAFTQAHVSDTRKYGGTGLGLTISRRLVELMGGSIDFNSEYGKGTSFFFNVSLPVALGYNDQEKEQSAERVLKGKRIIIVDDNASSRELLNEEVELWGMLPTTFSEAATALEYLRLGRRYDVALIDYQLPKMSGRMLADAVHKQSAENRNLPVVLLSNSYEQFSVDPAVNAWLSKPVKHESLRDQLVRILSDDPVQEEVEEDRLLLPHKSYDLRILVAEDNRLNQGIIKLMLERLGYHDAVIVPDGKDAVAAAIDAEYDVILMDIQMPGMNGLEATRKIREYTEDSDRPHVLALSAGVLDEERIAALSAGMNGFLSKPLAVEHLEKELASIRKKLS